MSDSKKIFINEEIIGHINFMTITGKIEVAVSSQNNFYVKDLIFISFTEHFKVSNTETMQLKLLDLLNMMYALEDLSKTGLNSWKKFTDSSKSSKSDAKKIKYLNAKEHENKIYINLNINEGNSEKTLMKVFFEKYELRGIIKTLEMFTLEYKTNFYKAQRAYNTLNEKRKSESKNQGDYYE